MTLKIHNVNSFLPICVLLLSSKRAVSILIVAIYLADYMMYVTYSFNFLFAAEETIFVEVSAVLLSCTSPETVQVNVDSYIVGDIYCQQNW
jgi:hypothetical protein